jgi:hypothetical protein
MGLHSRCWRVPAYQYSVFRRNPPLTDRAGKFQFPLQSRLATQARMPQPGLVAGILGRKDDRLTDLTLLN